MHPKKEPFKRRSLSHIFFIIINHDDTILQTNYSGTDLKHSPPFFYSPKKETRLAAYLYIKISPNNHPYYHST
ncbi:hypothetical protein PSEUDO8Z_160094 [Pseudomonas sp. 8Z]|nr:hypothetical protein PSEUDO8Z_160094 [Pseudomonas sp. 8Z]